MCVKSNLYKVAFTFVLPPDHNSGPWCKMLLSSEQNVVICKAHGLQNSWIHYSCFTSMCVAKKDQSRLSASLCKLSRRCLDLSFMFLCQSRVNDNMKRFSSCFKGCSKKFPRKNNVLLKLLGRIGWTANRCLAFSRNFFSLHISWQPLSSGAKLINPRTTLKLALILTIKMQLIGEEIRPNIEYAGISRPLSPMPPH